MAKRGNKPKFGRTRKLRTALYKGLLTALIDHGRVRTTGTRAKALAVNMEKMVTLAKKGDVASRRLAARTIGPAAVKKLFAEIGPKMTDRNGGYVRIIALPLRKSDGARMALIEFTS